jgi:hypothetical protein
MRALYAAFVVAATLVSCAGVVGNGDVRTEERKLEGFSSISLSGSGGLKIHRGDFKVVVRADANILPHVLTELRGSELRIGIEPGVSILRSTRLEYEVSLPELEGVAVSGSGEASLDPFSGKSFEGRLSGSGGLSGQLDYGEARLRASGSGRLALKAKLEELDLGLSGSGELRLAGNIGTGRVSLSGSGNVDARDCAFGDIEVHASGSGRVELRALGKLDAELSGSSQLRYWGSPGLSTRTSGSARVSKAGD